jgi:drug/metabolite transporter (DMT)-like permease
VANLFKNPYLLLTLTVLFWACNNVVARGAHDLIPPLALSYWRWTFAMLILLPFGGPPLWQARQAWAKHWKMLTVLAILSVGGYNTFLYLGLQYTTAVNASLIGATMPLQVVLLSLLILRTPVGGREGAGIALSLFGVVSIVAQGDFSALADLKFNPGDLIILGAVTIWSSYTVLMVKREDGLAPLPFLMGLMIVGWIFLLPLYLWEQSTGATVQWQQESYLAIAYVAVFPSILAYLFWNRGVRELGPNKTGMFVYLTPAFGASLGVIFLGETLDTYHFVGISLIFLGVWLSTKKKSS